MVILIAKNFIKKQKLKKLILNNSVISLYDILMLICLIAVPHIHDIFLHFP